MTLRLKEQWLYWSTFNYIFRLQRQMAGAYPLTPIDGVIRHAISNTWVMYDQCGTNLNMSLSVFYQFPLLWLLDFAWLMVWVSVNNVSNLIWRSILWIYHKWHIIGKVTVSTNISVCWANVQRTKNIKSFWLRRRYTHFCGTYFMENLWPERVIMNRLHFCDFSPIITTLFPYWTYQNIFIGFYWQFD